MRLRQIYILRIEYGNKVDTILMKLAYITIQTHLILFETPMSSRHALSIIVRALEGNGSNML